MVDFSDHLLHDPSIKITILIILFFENRIKVACKSEEMGPKSFGWLKKKSQVNKYYGEY